MVTGFEVHVDAAALADMERAEEAARANVHVMGSAGGKATMSGVYAPRIQSAGGKAAGKASLGRILKKPHQTAEQRAKAEYRRKYNAAKRAALRVPP